MSRRHLLQPNLVLCDSVYGLTPEVIRTHNLEGLVLDVDETLVPMNAMQATADLQAWIEAIRPLVSLWLVSNNLSEARIRRIATTLNVPYILGARKPSRRKLRRAVLAMDCPVDRIAMVGDRVFTDVLAGNRLGMFTILVDPMVGPASKYRLHWLRAFEIWISRLFGAQIPVKPNL